MPATYEPIATTTLGSAAATITFSSIPSTFTDLRLTLVGSTTTNAQYYLRFNNTTGFLYSSTAMDGEGTVNWARYTSANEIAVNGTNVTSTTAPSFFAVDVFSYAGSTNKTCLIDFNNDRNGSGFVERGVALWRSTAAITQVNLLLTGGNFATGTTATLYGIKNA